MSNDRARLAAEQHSIDCVPDAQRYGTPLRLFTIWLSINLSILCLTVGKLGVAAGLSFGWPALAVVVGNAIGTIFMAAHSTQWPHLGIPRMVQTRAQFGVLGAALPLLAVVATFTLFTTTNAIVLREPLKALMPLGNEGVLLAVLCAVLFVAAAVRLLLKRGFFARHPRSSLAHTAHMSTLAQRASSGKISSSWRRDFRREAILSLRCIGPMQLNAYY